MSVTVTVTATVTVTLKETLVAQEYYTVPWQHLSKAFKKKKISACVTISCNLSWDWHVMCIVHKADRMLGLLKKTCPLITEFKVRRTLYLSLVKSQLPYATEVWSPANIKLRTILERVQRRATRWILRARIGEI